ncbi:MAG: S-layer homology domain-containing protein [Acidimicrobiia bacterium]|nr:S-layer homology domain-containing protein [Acidimicrobiia bacterium]
MVRRVGVGLSSLVIAAVLSGTAAPTGAGAATAACGPLPEPSGPTVEVETTAELQAAVNALTSGTTILIADGIYALTNTLNIRGVENVVIRSASGDREAVVLQGRGMANAAYGNVPHVMAVYDAQNVQIADLTLRDAYYHLIQIHGEQDADGVHLRNLHLVDAGEQFVKGSTAGPPGPYADDGIVECSLFEYTDRARSWYTNGVDVLAGANWVIRDNTFRNIRAPSGELAGPAVLMWRNSIDTIVERNLFIECDRAIALGLSSPDGNSRNGESTYDHQGGIIRNNMIYRAGEGDIGISVNYVRDVEISHNTVILNGTFPWGAIEYRFGATTATIANNLTDAPIWQRNGATATVSGNVTTAVPGWFVDAAAGDLHLSGSATAAIDAANDSFAVGDDFDGHFRPVGSRSDVGADEYGSSGPLPPSGFRDVPPGHLFETDITWLASAGITQGCNPPINDLFCPDQPVSRQQMATFLVRALDLPPAVSEPFTDTNGSVHQRNIRALAAAGITRGCNPPANDRFCPTAPVTRGAMAAFLVRALDLNDSGAANEFVDDDGSVFEADIAQLAAAGITRGCNPPANDRFCPNRPVTRAQMAAFLERALG